MAPHGIVRSAHLRLKHSVSVHLVLVVLERCVERVLCFLDHIQRAEHQGLLLQTRGSMGLSLFLHNVSMKNRETGITSPRTLQTTVQSCWQRLKWWNFCKMAPIPSKLRLLVFTLAIYRLLHFKYTLFDKQANLERLFLITNTFSPHCLWLVVPILIVLTRSITNVASGVLLVLGGMSRSWGWVCCDCDGMFLMNTKLEKNINTQNHKNNRKKHYLKEPASHKKTAAFSFRVVVS